MPRPETEFHDAGEAAAYARYEAMAQHFAGAGAEPLVRFLVAMAAVSEARNPALRYRSLYEFLLREGMVLEAKPPPPGMRAGAPNRCYANCRAAAARRTARYAYCEGVAFPGHGIPVEHAWLVDLEDGRAVDPTWRGEPACAYLGVAVDPRYLRSAFPRSGCVLDDWRAKHPILTGEAGDAWRHDWHRRHTCQRAMEAAPDMAPKRQDQLLSTRSSGSTNHGVDVCRAPWGSAPVQRP